MDGWYGNGWIFTDGNDMRYGNTDRYRRTMKYTKWYNAMGEGVESKSRQS